MIRAIFVDRDGVVNIERKDYVKSWNEFQFRDDAIAGFVRLRMTGLPVVIVTNQSAVNRGLIMTKTLLDIHNKMKEEVEKNGGRIDLTLFCPHTPEEECECRKPRPGLLLRAATMYSVDLSKSYLIGDSVTDIKAAESVGCLTILIRQETSAISSTRPHLPDNLVTVHNFLEAVEVIQRSERTVTVLNKTSCSS